MKKTIKIFLYTAFGIYCLALIKFLLLDGRFQTEDSVGYYFSRSNLLPFKTVWAYIQKLKNDSINLVTVITNLFGNFIVLFPMGCFLPCLFFKMRKFTNTIFVCLAIVSVVELLQPLLCIGYFDIDDFIFNLTGAGLGFLTVHIPFLNKVLTNIGIYVEK